MPSPEEIVIFGAGGFAREVAWLLSYRERLGTHRVVGFVEDEAAEGKNVNGQPVMSWDAFMSLPQKPHMAIAVGDPWARKAIAMRCNEADARFATLVHHSVEMSEFVEIGVGSIICCGSILTVNIKLGRHVHVNLDCTIGHDVYIGDFSTLSPGVHVSGNVHIGDGVYIGTGANIINGVSDKPLVIADGTVIGAGACVTKSTEPYGLYAGVPAQLKKRYGLPDRRE